jgi:putative transferase (TIGR04331 family)
MFSFCWNNIVEYKFSRFITWGWSKHRNYKSNFIPLSSKLVESKIEGAMAKPLEHILLVGTKITPLTSGMSSLFHANQTYKYREDKKLFLRNLNEKIKKKLWYRPYPDNSTQFEDKGFVLKEFPDLKICNDEFQEKLQSAALVVSDHPGTTFYMMMGVNNPTIAFWDHANWLMTKESEAIFTELKAVNIVFNQPEEASAFINSISNIDDWWNSDLVQNARKSFCDKFANISKEKGNDWLNFVKSI